MDSFFKSKKDCQFVVNVDRLKRNGLNVDAFWGGNNRHRDILNFNSWTPPIQMACDIFQWRIFLTYYVRKKEKKKCQLWYMGI